MNLLDNAIRYTPTPGTISVSLRREEQMAVVAITDTGVGIPAEDIPFIFERFYRVDKSRSRAEGGSGLGLAICKHIVEAHGGKVEAESQVGVGSTFSVWLPLQSP
jgi:signal transduction histidine kinase